MSGPAYVSDPSVLYLHQLVEELAKGYLQVPQFQRRFVWTDDQRLELLRSIRDGIPIGSILVWRTGQTSLKTVRQIGPHELPTPVASPTSARNYLLDGLQRLSTLFGCLVPLPSSSIPFMIDDDGNTVSWRVGFDLATEQFQILNEEEAGAATWLPLDRLLDSVRLLQFQRALSNKLGDEADLCIQRADALAETFRQYKLPVVPVVTEDLATATRTFERVNRQGTPMSELHMVRALTWTEEFDLEDRFARVRESLAEFRWESLEPEWILKTCKAALGIDIAVENPDETSKRLLRRPEVIDEAALSLRRAAGWLREHCEIYSPKIVPNRMQVVMLAEVMRLCPRPDDTTTERLIQWFWRTTYTERFSGITGGQTMAMLEGLRSVALGQPLELKGKERPPRFSMPTTFKSSWVRVKAIALRLAALEPLDVDGTPIRASEQLANDGAAALVPLAPEWRAGGARMFTSPGSSLRALLLENATSIERRVLLSHAITPEAAQALVDRDMDLFLELRGTEIRRLEEQFLADHHVFD